MSVRTEINLGPAEIVIDKLMDAPKGWDAIVIVNTENLADMESDVEVRLEVRRSH